MDSAQLPISFKTGYLFAHVPSGNVPGGLQSLRDQSCLEFGLEELGLEL